MNLPALLLYNKTSMRYEYTPEKTIELIPTILKKQFQIIYFNSNLHIKEAKQLAHLIQKDLLPKLKESWNYQKI